jgi:hypothetical protein
MTLAQAPIGLGVAVRSALVGIDPRMQARLIAADGRGPDYFGWSVAISDSTAVVGAVLKYSGIPGNVGAAYVFVRSGGVWTKQAKLIASDGYLFAFSVAISESTIVVGSPFNGAAYVFVRSGTAWSQQAKLSASGGNFGISVAISGSTAVVGADAVNSNTGAAYVYERSETAWTLRTVLSAADGAANDYFGFSATLTGATAVVGAVEKNSGAGAAYVFVGSGATWSQQAELTASDAAAGDEFGNSVAFSGSTVLVGARSKSSRTGAAYVFVRAGTTWSQQAKLTASDGAGYEFGNSVAISGSTVVVASPNTSSGTGAAYVFEGSGASWSQLAKLAPCRVAGGGCGFSAAVTGSTVVEGAPANMPRTGAAYVYRLDR